MRPQIAEGVRLKYAKRLICKHHYAHSVPSGKSVYVRVEDAIVVFSIPANQHIGPFLLGKPANCWELSRLWAPDGHKRNLLTMAIASARKLFQQRHPEVEVLVSYADPNVGHEGHIYRAASWLYTGQAEEGRYYVDQQGQVVSRRKFHKGRKFLVKAEILALGYRELKRPGRHRFALGLNRFARRDLLRKWSSLTNGATRDTLT